MGKGTQEPLQCPVCRTALTIFSFHHVEVDVCPQCDGVWMDVGEMMAISKSAPLAEVDQSFEGTFKPATGAERQELERSDRMCPVDHHPMERHEFQGDSGVMMDFCSLCYGTWLDAGEIEGYVSYLEKSQHAVETLSKSLDVDFDAIERNFRQEMKDYAQRQPKMPLGQMLQGVGAELVQVMTRRNL